MQPEVWLPVARGDLMQFRPAPKGVDRFDGDTRLKASPKTSFLCVSVAEPQAVCVPGRYEWPSRLAAWYGLRCGVS